MISEISADIIFVQAESCTCNVCYVINYADLILALLHAHTIKSSPKKSAVR